VTTVRSFVQYVCRKLQRVEEWVVCQVAGMLASPVS